MDVRQPTAVASSQPLSRRKREFLDHIEATLDDQPTLARASTPQYYAKTPGSCGF